MNPKTQESSGAVIPLPGAFAHTDLGNAERLVAHHRGGIRYCPPRRKWLRWDGTRWEWDERDDIFRLAKQAVRAIYREASDCSDDEQRKQLVMHARRSEQLARVHAMVKAAQSEPGIAVLLGELDADRYALNCSNGTIDLRTGQLRKHDRRDLITKSTRLAFEPDARSELWDRVLHDATGGDADLAGYLQRVLGYALIGEPLERAFFFLFGPPGTAKSTLILAFAAALGDYAASAAFETWLVQSNVGGNRGDLVRLAGARLVTSVEVRHNARWDEALIKQVTGGDELVAAAKFEAEVSFRPGFTLVLAANDAPIAREDDAGLWARLRRIPLTAEIPPERQDPSIKTKLREPAHAAAVLAWAVAGCLAYQKGGLGVCRAVEASTAVYRAELDHFAEFLSDACLFAPHERVTRRALREAYVAWGEETGRRALLGARDVAARLRQRACGEVTVRGTKYWTGVRLRQPTDPDGVQMGFQGADGYSTPRAVLGIPAHERPLESDAPKCTHVHHGDADLERDAIQEEGR